MTFIFQEDYILRRIESTHAHYLGLMKKVSSKFHDLCEKKGLEPSSSEADDLFEQILNEVPGAEEAYETWGDIFDGTL